MAIWTGYRTRPSRRTVLARVIGGDEGKEVWQNVLDHVSSADQSISPFQLGALSESQRSTTCEPVLTAGVAWTSSFGYFWISREKVGGVFPMAALATKKTYDADARVITAHYNTKHLVRAFMSSDRDVPTIRSLLTRAFLPQDSIRSTSIH